MKDKRKSISTIWTKTHLRHDVGNGGEAFGFVTSNVSDSPSPACNVPNSISFATKVKRNTSQKIVNFRPLFTPAGDGVDVLFPKESNTWRKFGPVKSMMIKDMYLFKFGSKEGREAMLESGPWLTLNVPFILKQWTPDGRASYARAMIELKAEVDLRDTIVVVVPNSVVRGLLRALFVLSTSGHLLDVQNASTFVDEEDVWGNQTPSTNATPAVARINKLERQMLDGKLVLVKGDEVELLDDETSRYMSSTGGT
nr:hypothetical protein [Tanacetum cinerariifolium]